jgi:hypothetical protein
MPPLGSGGDCPNPEPCTVITNASCVLYTGTDKLCGEDTVYESGQRLPQVLSDIVDYFCARVPQEYTIESNILCEDTVVISEGSTIQEAFESLVAFLCGQTRD